MLISRGGVPAAKLVRVGDDPSRRRRFGILEGKVKIPVDLDDPLADGVVASSVGR